MFIILNNNKVHVYMNIKYIQIFILKATGMEALTCDELDMVIDSYNQWKVRLNVFMYFSCILMYS